MRILFFRLTFVLYVLQLSGSNRFWKNVQNTDAITYKLALLYQKMLGKHIKGKLDIGFLRKCKSSDVYSAKQKPVGGRNNFYSTNLTNDIRERNNEFRRLFLKHEELKV